MSPTRVRFLSTALGALVVTAAPAAAQDNTNGAVPPANAAAATVRSVKATRLASGIRIDGRLDDAEWARAEVATGFTQAWPRPGERASDSTEVRVLYDDEAIYVAVRNFDRQPELIAAPLARRDASGIYSDWVHLVIDSYHDRRNAFRFSVNPRGVQKDVLHSDDQSEDLNWDAVWQVGTAIDSLGWVAEYRIPFSQLRFGGVSAGTERTWGFQVQRDVARSNERSSWSPWTQQAGGYVSRAGDVTGIVDIAMPRRLEVAPYASAKATRAPGTTANPFFRATDQSYSVGGDLKVGLPRGLTLTATVNPDFGQVEADPSVVNLTAFETSFTEKRPFFIEGSNFFNFGRVRVGPSYNGQQFFYSRRIGRVPQRGLSQSAGYQYVDRPDQTTILGAAKVTGKSGPWTVGILDAVTDREDAAFQHSSLGRGFAQVEPRANYFVGRARREFRRGHTVFGGMLSATHRDLADTNLAKLLRGRALLQGLDFEHLWGNRQWSLSGYAARSEIVGRKNVIANAQVSSARYYHRPDADHLEYDPNRAGLTGYMTQLSLQKQGRIYLSADFKQASPGFEVNDLGFQGRVDYRSFATGVGYNQFSEGKYFRNWSVFAGNNNAWNYGGDRIWDSWFFSSNVGLKNMWYTGMEMGINPQVQSDRLTWGGPLAKRPTNWYAGTYGGSDSRKRVSAGWHFFWNGVDGGYGGPSAGLSVDMRPSTTVRITMGPSYNRYREPLQFVTAVADAGATETYGSRYVFATVDQETISMTTRVDWVFSPTLSFQLYAQPFVSAGHFHDYRSLRAARSGEYDAFAYTGGNPDYNVRSLRGNAVVRWEYRPGSTIYVVWQQGRNGQGTPGEFDWRDDMRGIWDTMPTNTLLVKASYWFAR